MEDYIEFDKYGLKEVRCMLCGTVVADRQYNEIPDPRDDNKTINVMSVERNSSWKQPQKVEIEIDDLRSYVEPIVCANCEDKDLNSETILEQIKKGWDIERKAIGKLPKKIKIKLKKKKKE